MNTNRWKLFHKHFLNIGRETMKTNRWTLLTVTAILAMLVLGTACGAAPTPEVIEKEVVVEKPVVQTVVVEKEKVVKETVVETVVVEKKKEVAVKETVVVEKVVTATPEPREPVTLRVGTTNIMDTINPHTFWYGWTIRWLWYDTPVQSAAIADFQPALAESWEVSDDGLVWTFKIREGVTFHDGTPCDAEAIAWSMNYMYQVQNTPVSYLWNFDWTPIEKIEALDSTTLQITTSEPVGNMLYRLFYAYIIPKSVWEGMETAEEAKAFDDIAACTGTGAYKCVEWVPDEYLILEAYEDHWRGKPAIDRIIIQQYASEDALVEALLAGEIDATYASGTAVETLQADPNIRVLVEEGIEWDQLVFNSTEPCAEGQESTDYEPCGTQPESLGDPIIREAMDYAIDRDRIIAIGYAGYGSPAGSVIPPSHGDYHDPYLAPTRHDVDYANSILDDAGYVDTDGDGVREWSDGTPLEYRLMTSDDPLHARLVELVQEDMAEIGISVVVELLDSGTLSSRKAPAWDFDMWYFSYGSDVDPDFPLITIQCGERYPYGWNYSGYCSEQGDANYHASVTAIDHDERVRIVHKAQEFIYNERPWIMIAYTNTIAAYRSDRFTGLGGVGGYADFMYVLSILGAMPVQ